MSNLRYWDKSQRVQLAKALEKVDSSNNDSPDRNSALEYLTGA